MRILFTGTPKIAVSALEYLASHHDIAAVVCAPDARVGRKAILTPPPIKVCAEKLGLVVLQPEKITAEFSKEIAQLRADMLVCFAYGKIFPQAFLDLFPAGAINLHPSLLPLWRGPSPIQAAIMAGDARTGITVQHMVREMDAGPMILQEELPLDAQETACSLGGKIAQKAGLLLQQAITMLEDKTSPDMPQDSQQATYCHFITKNTGHLNYQNSAYQLACLVRAMYDSPIAYSHWQEKVLHVLCAKAIAQQDVGVPAGTPGQILAYHKEFGLLVQTGEGVLGLQELQLAGKKRLTHKEFINGHANMVGDYLK